MPDSFAQSALHYHRYPTPGKLTVTPTKPLVNQRDLSLAYTPGVAEACREIVNDPSEVSRVTSRANLVGVVTNGTAVLGLGPIGPLASKPVMEGKAVLFKKFAGIDVFDIEIDETDPERMVEIIASLEPTFGAINLEDIKAPECFIIEDALKKRMNIPVFHDDQHGTAIVVSAAAMNGLYLAGKNIEDVKVVSTGGGAAGIACLNLLIKLGLKRENIFLSDHLGVVYEGREKDMTEAKRAFAQNTSERELIDIFSDADLFLGLSAGGIVTKDMIARMADQPIILALANPSPEILPEHAHSVRDDIIMATGRSDYPNQVNNVICFPYIFRGALDVGATEINDAMIEAAVHSIADLARSGSSDIAAAAYGGTSLTFGRNYLIPRPFDPRLVVEVPSAVANAAIGSGVAVRPIADISNYREDLYQFVYRSGLAMRPIFERARSETRRIAFAEGEDERVLYALKAVLDDKLAEPVLIGRPTVVKSRLERIGLDLIPGEDFEIVNPESDDRYWEYWNHYLEIAGRRGATPEIARTRVRTNTTVIASIMLDRGEVDGMICGTFSSYPNHLRHVQDIIGLAPGIKTPSTLALMIHKTGPIFLTDCYIAENPDAEQIAEQTILAAEEIRRFGLEPRTALLSHSTFGSRQCASADKMQTVLELLRQRVPDLMVDGEMQSHIALLPEMRTSQLPSGTLKDTANLLVFPTLDSANIALNLIRTLGEAQIVGPILLGLNKPAHILSSSVTARGLVNMCALSAAEANGETRKNLR